MSPLDGAPRPWAARAAPTPPRQQGVVEKWILIPDCHVPYQDKRALGLVMRVAEGIGAPNVAILGDFADCYAVSRFPKPPERKLDMQWEIDEANAALDVICRVFSGEKKITLGNHEARMERYVAEKAPELARMVRIDEMLRLKDRGFQVTPYKSHTQIGKLYLTHEVGNAGVNAHRQAMHAFGGNVAIGHTHHLAWSVEGNILGRPHVCAMLGWLGDVDQVDYMHRARAMKWSHGFGVAYVEPDGIVHLQPVAIVKGRACVEGRVFR